MDIVFAVSLVISWVVLSVIFAIGIKRFINYVKRNDKN